MIVPPEIAKMLLEMAKQRKALAWKHTLKLRHNGTFTEIVDNTIEIISSPEKEITEEEDCSKKIT